MFYSTGVLHLYQDELKDMDFISAAQFLTKLPEDLDTEALFKSISSVSLTADGMSFEELASCCELDSTLDDDVTVRLWYRRPLTEVGFWDLVDALSFRVRL